MRQVVFICDKEEEEEVQNEEIYVLKHTHMQSQVIHNTIPLLFKCHNFRTVSARECMYSPQCRIHHMEIRNKNRFSWELKHSNGNNRLNQIDSFILLSLENKIYLRETKLFNFICSNNRSIVNRDKKNANFGTTRIETEISICLRPQRHHSSTFNLFENIEVLFISKNLTFNFPTTRTSVERQTYSTTSFRFHKHWLA